MASALKIEKTEFSPKTLSQIAQQAAHDIRSPLSALNIVTRSCQNQMSDEAKNLMLAAIQRINDIANDLLKLQIPTEEQSPIESCTTTNTNQECIAQITEQIISEKRLKFQDSKRNIDFETNFDSSLKILSPIPKCEIQRILSNLIENAGESIEHSFGKISISIKTDKDFIHVNICDNGKGIPQNILSKLGTRGFSYGKSNTESGSGLGVFHAKSVLKSYGGKLEVSSTEGKGTTITLKLPLSKTVNTQIGNKC